MKATKISNHVTQLTRFGLMNAFFVEEDDGLTLVDTLVSGSGKQFVQQAAAMGKPIRRILLTHAHMDHAGGVEELLTAVPQAELLLTKRSAAFLDGDMSLHSGEPQSKLRGSYLQFDVTPTAIIAPGQQVGSLKIVASPGHTPDHVAYLDSRDGTLIAGDAFQTQGGIAVAGTMRWLFPLPAFATWDRETAVSSAKKLLALNPTTLAVGHGKALPNPMPKMKQAIEAANG